MKKKPNSAASRPLKHALHPFLALVLISGLISVFVYVRGRAQTNPQQQTSDTTGDRVLIQSNSSRIITSSPESLNAQTESSLGAFLEKHPGTWRIYVENGYTKVLRPVSSVSINTAPRDFSSQLLNEFSEIFGIGSAEISYVTDYNLGERHVVEYRQVIAGIPVEYSHITFSINGPGLEQISSRVYPEAKREIVGTSAAVDEQTAIKVINDDIASEAVKTQDLNLSYRASLSILSEQSSTTLTWKVIVTAKGALFSFTYYVDAASGRIVKKYSNVKSQKQAEQSQDSGESIHQASAVLNRENAATTIPGVEKNGASVMQESRSQDTFAAGWQHILSENFDTLEFPYSPWAVFDNNGSTGGQLFWDDQNCIFNDPSWSLWAADGGANRLNACTDNYANNMNSWVVYGPFSLADASDGLFDFHYRNDSEANFDYFNWLASVDGTTFHGFRVSGSSNGWRYQSLDFKNIPTLGNIVGRPQVWIAFVFTSDSTVISGKGPFVDDVAIKKFVNMSCTGVSGHVGGHIYGRNKNELQLSNFKNMKVVLDRSFAFDSHTVTDASGNYSSSECSDSIRFELEGFGSRNYVKVKDCNNGVCNPGDVLQSASLPFTSQVNFDWNEDAEDKKEVNVFWHLNEIHDWFKALIGQDLMNYQLPAQVDYLDGQSCNNGDVNAFYNPGDAGIYFCPSDVSRESDVIYHEYTHGVIDHIANYTLPYQDESGAINEGVADYYAAVKNNDATIGEGVGVIRRITDVVNFSDKCNRESGSGCRNDQYWLRSTSPARGNDYGYVHHNSLVPSGALWNLRQSQGLSQSYVDKLVIDTLIFHRPLNFTQLLNGLIAQDGGARESQIRAAFATRGVGNALPTLTSSLVISPSGPYMAGQTITGSFSITNRGSSAITLDVLTIGGRLNSDSTVRDFPWLTNVTLNPNQTRTYQSTFLLSEAGNYRFFPAYRTGGIWKIGLLGEIAKDPGVIDLVSFTVNPTCSGPGAFSLSSPGNGQSVTSTTSVNLTWQASANASSYDVFFGTSFNPQFLANQTGTSRTVSVTPGQTYWWKVVAKVNCNSSLTNATPVWSFTVQPSCNAPGAFSLSAPDNSQILSSTTSVNLTWQASANASSYDVFFGTSSNPQFLANQTGTSRTVSVTSGQTYWWKVVAKVNCNSSLTTTTPVWSFTVQPSCNAPGAFSLSAPGNSQSLSSTTSVNLTWQASANASSYDVFFGTSFNPQFLANQTGTSRTVSVTPGQTYWWKVVAKVNCNSSLTTATPVWSFTVQPSCNAPGAFSLSAPGNSQSLSSTTSVNLTWQASANASSYDVFFGTSFNPQFLANQTGTSRTVSVTSGQTYWWKVVAKVNCNSSLTTAAGVWSFSVQTVSPGSVIQFGNPSYAVAENGTIGTVTITRFGDVSGTATVNYATSDAAGLNNCSIISGNASSRCDYSFLTGTLSFGPGETFKAISIPIVDDTYAEGNEMFSISLSNPVGPTLGAPNVATVIINDNETFPGANPISNAPFFVRQHYRDFLNREPDSAGLSFWTNEIASCGSNQQCLELKQTNASAAFFLSIEFQETGYLAYRMYKAAFGDTTSPNVAIPVPIVRFNEFLPDAQRIGQGVQVGIGGWQTHLENNKRAYALEFVQRPQFISAYPLSLTSAQFVDRLNQNAGGVLSATERDQLIAELNAAGDVTQKRASVFRKVAEDADLRHRETNRAFVLMQYYGYLRRNPNDPQDFDFRGWEFWLNKLNQFNGNFVQAEMVKAFIVSAEYRQRFGP